jgi:hypothetical protein
LAEWMPWWHSRRWFFCFPFVYEGWAEDERVRARLVP